MFTLYVQVTIGKNIDNISYRKEKKKYAGVTEENPSLLIKIDRRSIGPRVFPL